MKNLLRLFFLITLLTTLLCAGRALPVTAQPAADDFSQIDAYIQATMRRLPIKGMALAIVKGDQILYMQGYGIANTQGDPVTPQTPFMLGSITKSFTALAVQQLINEKKISQYRPVQYYIPAFRLADERGGADVNVRHLLDHTSGISTEEGDQYYLLLDSKMTFPQALDNLARFRPQYKPGEHEEYSNWNYALLREVIAKASGQTFADYMQQHILDPLGMTHSSFADYHTLPHAATYDLNVFGFPVPYDEPYVPVQIGAAQLTATVEDFTHYMIAFMNHGQYQDQVILPAQGYASGSGWYDVYWNWNAGGLEGVSATNSGSHNSTYSSAYYILQDRLGVAVLMNTNLSELISTAPTANDITTNIANMMEGEPYALPNFNGFYVAVILIDGLLLIFIASLAWQALRLKRWVKQYQAAGLSGRAAAARRRMAWLGIVLDLLVCGGILAVPLVFHLHWYTLLSVRPDTFIPILAVGICLGALGLIKAASSMVLLKQKA